MKGWFPLLILLAIPMVAANSTNLENVTITSLREWYVDQQYSIRVVTTDIAGNAVDADSIDFTILEGAAEKNGYAHPRTGFYEQNFTITNDRVQLLRVLVNVSKDNQSKSGVVVAIARQDTTPPWDGELGTTEKIRRYLEEKPSLAFAIFAGLIVILLLAAVIFNSKK